MLEILRRIFGTVTEDPMSPELEAAKARLTAAFQISHDARADNAQAIDNLTRALDRREHARGR